LAAPLKEGLDYFPFSVDLFDDEELDYLREQYGAVINDVYILLLCLTYKKKGYYIPYETSKDKKECVWFVYKHIRGGKYPIKLEAIPDMIEALVRERLFSAAHYPKIITSERIQVTYYKATVDRKPESLDIRDDIWMLSAEQMRKLSQKHPYYLSVTSEPLSDDLPNKSGDLLDNSNDLSLNKIKVNNTIKVSKKEIKKENNQSYDDIFSDMCVNDRVKNALIDFIRHLKVNGVVMINSRLESLITKLDIAYGQDELAKAKEIRKAIVNGYKRLPCEGEED
jgi:hypothetical protein